MNIRGIITFLIGLGLVIIVVILMFRFITGSNGDDASQDEQAAEMTSFADTGTAVQMTAAGIVNADSEHQGLRIAVSRSEARIEVLSGYEQKVIDQRSYANNEDAYREFLQALELAGYTNTGSTADPDPSEEGQCSSGSRYVFELNNGSATFNRQWATSCGTASADFTGTRGTLLQLFRHQIPEEDYENLTESLNISNL